MEQKELEEHLFKLKLLLDESVKFPSEYWFKFIVPTEAINYLTLILKDMEIDYKPSNNGKYMSLSAKKIMNSSDEIIDVYQKASVVKGIISL